MDQALGQSFLFNHFIPVKHSLHLQSVQLYHKFTKLFKSIKYICNTDLIYRLSFSQSIIDYITGMGMGVEALACVNPPPYLLHLVG